jgi:large subunit ribosomal protein L2
LQNPDLKYVRVRLPSGSQRLISINAKGTLGVVANENHILINLKKAGRSR